MSYQLSDLHRTGRNVILRAPDVGILWAKLKHLARVAGDCPGGVACVADNGTVTVHPTGYGARPDDEKEFILAHELMHFLLSHHDRVLSVKNRAGLPIMSKVDDGFKVDDPDARKHWGIATDVVINETLRKLGFVVPSDACMLGNMGKGYTGALASEPLYQHLLSEAAKAESSGGQKQPDPQGKPAPGRGCSPDGNEPETQSSESPGAGGQPGEKPSKGSGSPLDALDKVSLDPATEAAESILSTAGVGSAIADMLNASRVKSLGWRDVLKRGMLSAAANGTRCQTSWQVLKRKTWRNGDDENGRIVYPGQRPSAPCVAVVVDVSGSMSREDLNKVVTHTLEIQKTVNVRIYLVTHTDTVCWKGWIKPGDKESIMKATAFTGGTSFDGAYAAVAEAGKFDALIHFTDTQVSSWPRVPAKDLTVALVGATQFYAQPPRSRFTVMQVTNRN